ncbi:MAG: hypothetical protein P8K77_03530 [Polaribacter sp.]|nr:hypothetical protein [Polaribacter sp.]
MMHKKIAILTTVFLLFLGSNIFSQERKEGRKRIKTLKISFITEKLDLTEKEAALFWPIYNKFEKKRMSLHHSERYELKKRIEKLGGIDHLKESDAKAISKEILTIQKSLYQAHLDFHKEIKTVISYKKLIQLQMVEREFNKKLFSRYRKHRKTKKGTK